MDKVNLFKVKEQEANDFAIDVLSSLEAQGEITAEEKQAKLALIFASNAALYDPLIAVKKAP